MNVTRKSQMSGEVNTLDLDVTQDQLDLYAEGNTLIQEVFLDLRIQEREFIKTGITPKEWKEMFGEMTL